MGGEQGAAGGDRRSQQLVGEAVVREAVGEWREHVAAAVSRKVHAELVLGLLDTLPAALGESVAAFASEFDLATAREQLVARSEQLQRERVAIGRMAHKFEQVARSHHQTRDEAPQATAAAAEP